MKTNISSFPALRLAVAAMLAILNASPSTALGAPSDGQFINIGLSGSLFLPATSFTGETTNGAICCNNQTLLHAFGNENCFVGLGAGNFRMGGANNTAIGYWALSQNMGGSNNTANGSLALSSSMTGNNNTANGYWALFANTGGSYNTACGSWALNQNTSGNYNIALGYQAGMSILGNSNIDIGHTGFSSDIMVIRIGDRQTRTFIAGVITGNGSGLTSLNANNIASGIVPLAQLAGITSNQLDAATWQLATNLNGGNAALASNVVAGIGITNAFITNSVFAGDGGGLTNLNANNIASGTVPLAQLAGITGNQLDAATWQLATNLNGGNAALASNVVAGIGITNAFITNSVFAGDGGGLTNLNASCLIGSVKFTDDVEARRLNIGTNNTLDGQYVTVAGGSNNIVSGDNATVGGGSGNKAFGVCPTVGGGNNNVAGHREGWPPHYNGPWPSSPVFTGATVSGGYGNTASGNYATVAGGTNNSAVNDNTTVGGGSGNIASGTANTVGGGTNNTTVNYASTVGGGEGNHAGKHATVPGGYQNAASGQYSFAAGQQAHALHSGAFVWADSQSGIFASTTSNEFSIRAQNGVHIQSDRGIHLPAADGVPLIVRDWDTFAASAPAAKAGLGRWGLFQEPHYLTLGIPDDNIPGAFQVAKYNTDGTLKQLIQVDQSGNILALGKVCANGIDCGSDRNVKENFAPVNAGDVLERVAHLPMNRWNFKTDPATRHIGPMAQDFYATFGVGSDDKHISPMDEGGVALASIQGLNQKLEETRAENADLKARLEKLECLLNQQKTGGR